MPLSTSLLAPDFMSLKTILRDRSVAVEDTMECFIALLKRRQIRGYRQCAEATALLLSRMIENVKLANVHELLQSVREVGRRLVMAQPIELAIGNVVRRVLALIREEAEENRDSEASIDTSPLDLTSESYASGRPSTETASRAKIHSSVDPLASCQIDIHNVPGAKHAVKPITKVMYNPLPSSTFPFTASMTYSPAAPQSTLKAIAKSHGTAAELRAEIVEGIDEILEELQQADEQIASYAPEHIFVNEIVLTQGCSETIQKFLLKAASRRKFTVIHVETYPYNSLDTYVTKLSGDGRFARQGHREATFIKALTAAGITAIVLPASAVFAIMSRVNKVVLDTHAVLADGGLVTVAGARQIAMSAYAHRVPVIILSGILQLSPVYPFDFCTYMGTANPSNVVLYQDGPFVDQVSIQNPAFDYIPASLVELYITNIGGHAPSFLYRLIEDHYRVEDLELGYPSTK